MYLFHNPINAFSKFTVFMSFALATPLLFAEQSIENILLPTIEVTASKRKEALFNAPYTIDVIDESLLKSANVNQLTNISTLSSNLSIQQNGVYKNTIIRGIGGGGRNAGFDARTAVYIDGVNVGQTIALETLMFDIDHIEVIKGPQGHSFGNQSDSGAINIQSNRASQSPFAGIKLGVGNLEYKESEAILNLPFGQDVSSRIAIRAESRDGYVNNDFDQSMLKGFDNLAVKANLQINTSASHTLKLFADYAEQHNQNFLAQPLTGMFGQPNQTSNTFSKAALNTKPSANIQSHGVSLQSERILADESKLELIFAARESKLARKTDNDYSSKDVLMTDYSDSNKFYSQEIRFTSNELSNIRYLAGLYFSQEQNNNDRRALLGTDMSTRVKLPNIPISLPFGRVFSVKAGATIPIDATVKTDIQSLYSNVSYDLEKFTLHAGGRYQLEQKYLDFTMDGSQSGAFNIGTLNGDKQQISNQFFSPMVALSYHQNDSNEFFGKYSRSYKSGGWNVDFLNRSQIRDGFEYRPESVNSFEMGWRQQAPTYRINASLFLNQYHDYQVFQFANLGGNAQILQLRNAATVRTQGVELGANFALTNAFKIQSNIGFLDANYVSFPSGATNGTDASGNQLPDAPTWSLSNTLSYNFHSSILQGNLDASAQYFFQSETYSGISNEPELSGLPSRNLINGSISYTPDFYKASQFFFWVRNLTNQHFAVAKGKDILGNQIAIYNEPRVLGVAFNLQF